MDLLGTEDKDLSSEVPSINLSSQNVYFLQIDLYAEILILFKLNLKGKSEVPLKKVN